MQPVPLSALCPPSSSPAWRPSAGLQRGSRERERGAKKRKAVKKKRDFFPLPFLTPDSYSGVSLMTTLTCDETQDFTLINYDKEQIQGTGHEGFSYFVKNQPNTFPQTVNGIVLRFDLLPCHSRPATTPSDARNEEGMLNLLRLCLLCAKVKRGGCTNLYSDFAFFFPPPKPSQGLCGN